MIKSIDRQFIIDSCHNKDYITDVLDRGEDYIKRFVRQRSSLPDGFSDVHGIPDVVSKELVPFINSRLRSRSLRVFASMPSPSDCCYILLNRCDVLENVLTMGNKEISYELASISRELAPLAMLIFLRDFDSRLSSHPAFVPTCNMSHKQFFSCLLSRIWPYLNFDLARLLRSLDRTIDAFNQSHGSSFCLYLKPDPMYSIPFGWSLASKV